MNLRSKAEGDPRDILTLWTYINSPVCVLLLDTCAEGHVLADGLWSYWEREEGPLRAHGTRGLGGWSMRGYRRVSSPQSKYHGNEPEDTPKSWCGSKGRGLLELGSRAVVWVLMGGPSEPTVGQVEAAQAPRGQGNAGSQWGRRNIFRQGVLTQLSLVYFPPLIFLLIRKGRMFEKF